MNRSARGRPARQQLGQNYQENENSNLVTYILVGSFVVLLIVFFVKVACESDSRNDIIKNAIFQETLALAKHCIETGKLRDKKLGDAEFMNLLASCQQTFKKIDYERDPIFLETKEEMSGPFGIVWLTIFIMTVVSALTRRR